MTLSVVDVLAGLVVLGAIVIGTWIVAKQVGYEECVADFTEKPKG